MVEPAHRTLRGSFLALALPNIAASLLVPLSGLVDTAMLGHLDELGPLAGVALGGIIFDYLYWSFGFLRMGTTGLTARAFGAARYGEARALLLRAVVLAVVFGALILALMKPIGWLGFEILEGTEDVHRSGRAYFGARVWGAPAVLINYAIAGWLLGIQKPKDILILSAVANATNIGLDYVFVLRWGWGAAGAGWATMLSQVVMLLLAIPLARRHWARLGPEQTTEPVLEVGRLRSMLALGRDIWIRTFALLSAFALFTNFSAAVSPLVLAANAVLLRVLSLASYLIDGFAHATETLAGANAGAKNRAGLSRLLALATRWAVATGLVFALAFALVPELFALLTDQPELLEEIEAGRWWLLAVLPVGAIAYVLDGYFIGLAAGPTMARAMIVSFVLGFLPLALWARYLDGPMMLLWMALVMFMLARVITLGRHVPRTLREP